MKKIAVIDYGAGNLRSVLNSLEFCGASGQIVREAGELAGFERAILPGVGAFGEAMARLRALKMDGAVLDFCASGKPFLGICLGMQLLFETSYEFEKTRGLGILKGEVVAFDVAKFSADLAGKFDENRADFGSKFSKNCDDFNENGGNFDVAKPAQNNTEFGKINGEICADLGKIHNDFCNQNKDFTTNPAKPPQPRHSNPAATAPQPRDHHATTRLKIPHTGWNECEFLRQSPLNSNLSPREFFYFVHSFHAVCDDKIALCKTFYGYEFISAVWQKNIFGFQPHPEKSGAAGLAVLKNFCEL